MGNCRGKDSVPKVTRVIPNRGYEEHTISKRNVRLGIQVEKNPEGEIHVGLPGGLEHKRDRVVKVDEEGSVDDEGNLNKIPKILDIINENGGKEKYEERYPPEQ